MITTLLLICFYSAQGRRKQLKSGSTPNADSALQKPRSAREKKGVRKQHEDAHPSHARTTRALAGWCASGYLKMALLTFMTFTLFGACVLTKHPRGQVQLAKMASVCPLCGSSVSYSHYIENNRASIVWYIKKKKKKKKTSQARLASRMSTHTVGLNVERWQPLSESVMDLTN